MVLALWLLVVLATVGCSTGTTAQGSTTSTTTTGDGGVHVFNEGESGYFCIKIPSLTRAVNGSLIATGEARLSSCSDYTTTHLVYKVSYNGGLTWGPLRVLMTGAAVDNATVVGNAAPVVLRETGEIVLVFCSDNQRVWQVSSNDNGESWGLPRELTTNVTKPEWKWIGTGPPATLQLASGRLLTPCYHTFLHASDGEVSFGHIMYSDDLGVSWQLGPTIEDLRLPNECQAAQLPNGTVLVNSRTFVSTRLLSVLGDDGSSILEGPAAIRGLREPLQGCEGSTVWHDGVAALLYSGINSHIVERYNLTLFVSTDGGLSFEALSVLNEGPSGYSTLLPLTASESSEPSVAVLFEESTEGGIIFVPQHITFRVVALT